MYRCVYVYIHIYTYIDKIHIHRAQVTGSGIFAVFAVWRASESDRMLNGDRLVGFTQDM